MNTYPEPTHARGEQLKAFEVEMLRGETERCIRQRIEANLEMAYNFRLSENPLTRIEAPLYEAEARNIRIAVAGLGYDCDLETCAYCGKPAAETDASDIYACYEHRK